MADIKQHAKNDDVTGEKASNIYEIFPFLFLSTFHASEQYEAMIGMKITNIINLSNSKKETPTAKHLELFDVMYLPLPDTENYVILTVVETCSFFIHKLQTNEKDKKILVNCSAGKSRSVSVIIAYCMIYSNMELTESYNYILSIKPDIEPNLGFLRCLMDLEKKVFHLNKSTFDFRTAQINEIKKYILKDSNKTDKEISIALDQCNDDHNKAAALLQM